MINYLCHVGRISLQFFDRNKLFEQSYLLPGVNTASKVHQLKTKERYVPKFGFCQIHMIMYIIVYIYKMTKEKYFTIKVICSLL